MLRAIRVDEVPLGSIFLYQPENQSLRAWIRINIGGGDIVGESLYSYKEYRTPSKYLKLGRSTIVIGFKP